MSNPRLNWAMLTSAIVLAPAILAAASLRPETIAGWDAYVRATEARIARELASGDGFLAMDFAPSRVADRAAVVGGRMLVAQLASTGSDGREVAVPDGLVHHWRGSVFIPRGSLEQVLASVSHPEAADALQEDVIALRVLDRGPGSLRLFLRLQRTQLVTVVYNTEHAVDYTRLSRTRASSRSVATRIAEVADPATPTERERPLGKDHGFLWRLNSYWRYEQAAGGVLVECESISLSRSVPTLARGVVRPVIDQVARGSMERTLAALRSRLAPAPSPGS